MSFLHPALLGLLALAAVPVVLHFLLKPKPKRLVFPALRLLKERRRQNDRRMRLRHLWLLLLRMLLLAVLVLAVARPSLPPANYSPTTAEWVTLAAVVAVVIAAYHGMMALWRRSGMGRADLLYRRTLLRGGTTAAAFLLAAALVFWPYGRRVAAEIRSPQPIAAEDQPVAAVFLFDTSDSMGFVRAGESRLDAAKALAARHLNELPPGSKLALAASGSVEPLRFRGDLFGSEGRIDAIETSAVARPLGDRLRAALRLHADDAARLAGAGGDSSGGDVDGDGGDAVRDRFVRGVYLFTDLAASAWGGDADLDDELARQESVQLFLVDVGVTDPANTALGRPVLPRESVPAGALAGVRAAVSRTGPSAGPVAVELLTRGADGEFVSRGRQSVELAAGEAKEVAFPLRVPSEAKPGGRESVPAALEGVLRLTAADPLAADDERFFTLGVQAPRRVLILADRPADADIVAKALAPSSLVERNRAAFVVDVADADPPGGLDPAALNLGGYEVVHLLNVSDPPPTLWDALAGFTRSGGGVGVILGDAADPFAYGNDAAAAVLPARPLTSLGFEPPEFLRVVEREHPVFAEFLRLGGTAELTTRDVRRHWKLEPAANATVLAEFTSPFEVRPALVAGAAGAGRVLVFGTGLDVRDGAWSDLPLAGWSYPVLLARMTAFLAGGGDRPHNFLAADRLSVELPRDTAGGAAVLRRPDFGQTEVELSGDGDRVTLGDVGAAGHYDLVRPGGAEVLAAFAVNGHPSESDLARLDADALDGLFGPNRYRLSRTAEEMELMLVRGRFGQEMFPYLLGILAAVFFGELLVSNRFYEEEQAPAAA